MTAIGPFRMLACHRNDLNVVAFDHIHHVAMAKYERQIEFGHARPNDVAAYMTLTGYVLRNAARQTRLQNMTLVLYYSDTDLLDLGHETRLVYRLKGGVDMRYSAPALVVETKDKIHVLKDRGLTLKPLIKAIHDEAPEMIGSTPYARLLDKDDED